MRNFLVEEGGDVTLPNALGLRGGGDLIFIAFPEVGRSDNPRRNGFGVPDDVDGRSRSLTGVFGLVGMPDWTDPRLTEP